MFISYEEYYSFGSTSYGSGKSVAEVSLKRYRYCGKERDEETGLYYYGARYFAAWIGRFISVDPLAEKFPQLTPYNYAGNKPVTAKDLEGLQSTRDTEVNPENENQFPNTTNEQELDPIILTHRSSRVQSLMDRGYTWEDIQFRDFLEENNTYYFQVVKRRENDGIYKPLTTSKGYWNDFESQFDAGWLSFDPNGTANFWMNAAAFGIGVPLVAGVGGSYFSAQLSSKLLLKMGIDAGAQYLLTGQVDYADVVIGGYTSPLLSPVLGGFIDITNNEINIYGITGDKTLKSTAVDIGTGYIMYGVGKYGDSVLTNYNGAENFGIEMYNHIVTSLGGTFMNSRIQESE